MIDPINEPLVSIALITYNQSQFIIDTLNSICNQTYKKLELIISDDCSEDNTVDLCKEWIKQHKERFVRTKIIVSKKNLGISSNRNRAEKECCGEWVKVFDGDDIMLLDCIENYVSFVNQYLDADFVFSYWKAFGGDSEYLRRVNEYSLTQKDFFKWTKRQQYDYLVLCSNRICGATFFYKKNVMKKMGIYCDERIPMIDDWPRWINLLKSDARLYLMEKETLLYRISDSSTCNQVVPSERFQKSRDLFFIHYQFKEYFRLGRRRYALREFLAIKSKWCGIPWKLVYGISKKII